MAISLAALRLLVVDDNAQMRTIIGTVLAAAGVRNLQYAQDGRRGLQAIEDFRPDVCYVDYEMPGMNGLDFLAKVRAKTTADRYMPIILLTGHSDLRRIHLARDHGATEFLCKPVSAHTILKRLEAVIMRPRPFVDSPGYFGPDRRRRRRQTTYGGPLRRRGEENDA